jgi:hypothetical protein
MDVSCDDEVLEVAGVAIEIDAGDVALVVVSVGQAHEIVAIGRGDVAIVDLHGDDLGVEDDDVVDEKLVVGDAVVEIAFVDEGASMAKDACLMAADSAMVVAIVATNQEVVADEDDGGVMDDVEVVAVAVVDDSMCAGDYVTVEVDALVDVVDASWCKTF